VKRRPSDIDTLAQDGVVMAIDTEFDAASTVSVQVATRDRQRRLLLQIYHAPEIGFPAKYRAQDHLTGLAHCVEKLLCRCPRVLSRNLSLAGMLIDVFGIRDGVPVSRIEGLTRVRDRNSRPANAGLLLKTWSSGYEGF